MVVSLESVVGIVFEQYGIVCMVARCRSVELMSVCWPRFFVSSGGRAFPPSAPRQAVVLLIVQYPKIPFC